MRSIFKALGRITLVLMLLSILVGCSSGGGGSQPILPDENISQPGLTGEVEAREATNENGHYLLLYNLIYIDPENADGPVVEVVPVRAGEIHLNILKFLEVGPCTDCFKLVGFDFPEPGVLDVDIEITHPFDDITFTIFDVRGIMMFQGSHTFPASGKTISDADLGDGSLLNPDGYTSLYNGNTIDAPTGDLQKYFPGNFSTPTIPDSDINGFIHYTSEEPGTNRNVFYHGTSVMQTFSIKLQTGPFVLGYAVDANWAMPSMVPPESIDDFGLDAQCPEPWKVVVTEEPIGDGLTNLGGETILLIDVYDWQGKETHHDPVVECPELFDGQLTATWLEDGPDHTRYEVTVLNDNLADVGDYMCLISVEANENNPALWWLDLTAYQIQMLTVIEEPTEDPVAIAQADPNPQTAGLPVHFSGADSYDPDGGNIQLYEWDWDNDSTYDQSGAEVDFTWGIEGTYEVQLRVTDDEGETDKLDEPLEVLINPEDPGPTDLIWAKRAGGAGWDGVFAITTLSDNSTIVIGSFNESATFGQGEPNETVLTSADLSDIFIARYNLDGTLAWAKRAGGADHEAGLAVTVLSDDSIVVSGNFYESATFGQGEPNETMLTSAGFWDIFIARYSPDGTLAWAKRAGGSAGDQGYAVTALSDNSIILSGSFPLSATFGQGEPNETLLTTYGYFDIFIARYNPDGTLAWAKHAGGTYEDRCCAITTLSDNSTVVSGAFALNYYGGPTTAIFGQGEANETTLTSAGNGDIFIARYNPDGTLAWAKSAGGSNSEIGYALTTLSDNSIVVTGVFPSSVTFGQGEPNETFLTSAGNTDIFLARYNLDGTLAWAKSAGGSEEDNGYSLAGCYDGSVFLCGIFNKSATFGKNEQNETLLDTGISLSSFIAHYNLDGTLRWAMPTGARGGGSGHTAITVLSDNTIVATGDFLGDATFGQGETGETVLTSAGQSDIFIARYAEQ